MSKAQRSSLEDQPPRDREYGEPPDPSERLKQLEHELTEHNNRIAHLTTQAGALLTDITDLEKTVKQVGTAVTNYGAGLKDLHNRLHALHHFYEQKSKMIHAAIGDMKGPIDELIRNFDLELARMGERLGELRELRDAMQRESDQAAANQESRQRDYDFVNDTQQRVTHNLDEMDSLRADITKADDKTDVATMYFLMLEFHDTLAETKIISQHQLSLELRQKLGELESAKEHARAKSADLSAAQAEYTNHETVWEKKKADRRKTLLAHIQKMCPVPPASDTPGGSAQPEGTASPDTSASPGFTPATPGAATPAPTPTTTTSTPPAAQKK